MENEIDIREIVFIIWKRKWLLICLVLSAVIASVLISFQIRPTYETSTSLALGRFDSETFNKPEYAKNLILAKENLFSNKELAQIIDQYNEPTLRTKLQSFKESVLISSEKDTNILKITVMHTNPKTAVKIADLLVNDFKQESDAMYKEKNGIPLEAIRFLESEFKNTESEIAIIKSWLSKVDEKHGGTIEEDLVLTRLRQTLNDYETQKLGLHEKIDTLKNQVLNHEPAVLLEVASEPKIPVKPNKMFMYAISIILALVGGVFLALGIEYFQRYPLRTIDK